MGPGEGLKIAPAEPSPTAEEHYKTARGTPGLIPKFRAGWRGVAEDVTEESTPSLTPARTTRYEIQGRWYLYGDGWGRGTWASRLAVAEEGLVVDPRLQALEVEPARGLGRQPPARRTGRCFALVLVRPVALVDFATSWRANFARNSQDCCQSPRLVDDVSQRTHAYIHLPIRLAYIRWRMLAIPRHGARCAG